MTVKTPADITNLTDADATHARCLECDALFPIVDDDIEDLDAEPIACDACDAAGNDPWCLEFVHVTSTPLGRDDDDFRIVGRYGADDEWHYPIER